MASSGAGKDEKRHSRASGEKIYSPPPSKPAETTELRRSCSIVMQDNRLRLAGVPEKTANALGRSYRVLREAAGELLRSATEKYHPGEEHPPPPPARPESKTEVTVEHAVPPDGRPEMPPARQYTISERAPLPKKHFSFDTTLRQRGELHLQSADLFDNFSPVQKQRQLWQPELPEVYSNPMVLAPVDAPELEQHDAEQLRALHAKTFAQPCLIARPPHEGEMLPIRNNALHKPFRVGVVLSGGPAPGGHNVIAGLFDYVKQSHAGSQVYGFMGGLDGVFQGKYRVITDDFMNRFRNQGGFDMLWSGRGRVNGAEDMIAAARMCHELDLDGLVVVGGDGSLSNAALLSEFFAEHLPQCCVVGVPKTIDGDLKNAWVETSFGFDTAAKTYSELIGNLCTDVTTGQQVYHFVRVMGRSASHLVVECALQTRPNLVLIGEEIEANNTTLPEIVEQIVQLIVDRKAKNKLFGIVLVPEGLIEFIPEIKVLISDLNSIMKTQGDPEAIMSKAQIVQQLTDRARQVWIFLPESIQDQLLMDREATGYIQVGKIATERLLKLLVEMELQRRGINLNDIIIMPHYFGYEGRCAMPSNFDANYCYCLGYTAGTLLANKKTGYVAAVRQLEQHATEWMPGGVPCTRIMEMKTGADGASFPAVIRQLFDLKGRLFEVLRDVRDYWRTEEFYRCPGPIQFEGPVANDANFTVSIPTKKQLLTEGSDHIVGVGKAVSPKRPGALSRLQKHRLQNRPEIPAICQDKFARAVPGTQYLPKDPFTQRQVLLYYPYICNSNQFHLHEVISDRNTPCVGPHLKVGVVFLSRQAPGVTNVLWGIMERLNIVQGHCIGFYGAEGLCTGRYIEIGPSELELYLNQGGMELLGRTAVHCLLNAENQEAARQTCMKLQLDGLVLVGSSLAMTEATLTAEYFLANGCQTCVIGVPATGSNNLTHELIETNIGFDTSSKVYASLIGNVLTDAASMPKYWHFVRLMGRQPSNEVLECALQTHPNVVIIAEEYGAANKTLGDVVRDIADVVCKRADMGKNFGSVLIPDGLLAHLPNMKALMSELSAVVREAEKSGELKSFQEELGTINDTNRPEGEGRWKSKITPWSLALFKSLPQFIRKELTQIDMGEMRFTLIETELLVSQMVQQELEARKKAGTFNGKFSAVCHFFGYQGRSSMPSRFDAALAFAYGHLATICVESGLTAHCCTIRGLCGEKKDWKLAAIPFNSMLMFTAQQDEVHPELRGKKELPIIPSAEVNLNGKAYRWMRTAVSQWQLQDRFCNPGPIQFDGLASTFYHRILHEEQAEYFRMLRHVQLYSQILRDTCSFGVDESFLKVVFSNLHALLSLRYHPDDLMSFLPALTDVKQYEAWQTSRGQRREVWESRQPPEAPSAMAPGITPATTVPLLHKRPSLIATLAAQRLQSRTFHPAPSKEEEEGPMLQRTNTVTDSGWGDQPGVEAYPRSSIAAKERQ